MGRAVVGCPTTSLVTLSPLSLPILSPGTEPEEAAETVWEDYDPALWGDDAAPTWETDLYEPELENVPAPAEPATDPKAIPANFKGG